MKLIPLTRGLFAKVSDRDYPKLRNRNWYAHYARPGVYYAARYVKVPKRQTIFMQWEIRGSRGIDHRNHDTLDNRRRNLRSANQSLNMGNTRKRSDNSSGFKGVSWEANRGWRADIQFLRRRFYLGHFSKLDNAAQAYDRAALLKFGKFSRLNFPKSKPTINKLKSNG